jgi:phage terminase large subunit
MIYEESWDAARNLINRFPIPREWPRYISIDFGMRNPCVVQWWAKDPDDKLYLYREIYMTGRSIEVIAKQVKEIHEREKEPLPYAVICDHNLGERTIFQDHTGWYTLAANKDVIAGIQCVAQRMKAGTLLILRDSLVERDPSLVEHHLPTCTAEEVEGYVWDANKERPVKENDHGMDNMRYQVTFHDLRKSDVTYGPKIF